MFEYWYAFPVVALGCTLTIMGGVGGNVLCGPFFILVLQLPPHVAIGTALVTEVFSMSSGVLGYAWRRLIDYRLAAILAAAAAPMAILGSWLSVRAPGALLRGIFGAAILVIATLLLRSTESAETADRPAPLSASPEAVPRTLVDSLGRTYRYEVRGRLPLAATSLAAGLGSGLIGIGGGELNTPFMAMRGVPIRVAAATAVAVMAVTVLAGAITHVLLGEPLWRLTIWTIPGAILGGQIGSFIANRTPAHRLRQWLSWLFVAVGTTMLVRAF
ncbi:MAG: sulfite exporter TauE/SafE family protein [Acidobacteria bacterium]|nr:sulfite exporter TauE/SafE family protein [Acidobacteriota bacterium]